MSIDAVGMHPANPATLARSPAIHRPEPTVKPSVAKQPLDMDTIMSDLAKVGAAFNHRLAFRVNEKLDQVVVKVIDVATDKVIREIPPEGLQNVHERIREVLGVLFDESA